MGTNEQNLDHDITQVEYVLTSLRSLQGTTDDDVQGHLKAYSDENLKQAITSLSDALEALKQISTQSRS